MCYNVKAKSFPKDLEKRFKKKAAEELKEAKPYEIVSGFDHPKIPVITSEKTNEISRMEWGLVPNWVKSEDAAMELKNQTLNARAESLFEKASFKSILQKRCLILVDGFYEWMHQARKKIPYYITAQPHPALSSGRGVNEPFALGGLYDEWVNTATGELFRGFSIITVPANPLMETIHNIKKRMPLILSRDNEMQWVQPDLDEAGIKSLLTQYPEELMRAEVYVKPIENSLFG